MFLFEKFDVYFLEIAENKYFKSIFKNRAGNGYSGFSRIIYNVGLNYF